MNWEQIVLSLLAAIGGGAISSWIITRANRRKVDADTADILSKVTKQLSDLLAESNAVIDKLRDQAEVSEETISKLNVSAAVEKILKEKDAEAHDDLVRRYAILNANYTGALTLQRELQEKIKTLSREDAQQAYEYQMLEALHGKCSFLVGALYIEIDQLRKKLGEPPVSEAEKREFSEPLNKT